MQDSLGDRMKLYENKYRNYLDGDCIVIRVDGKSFHSFTRNMDKPFDVNLITSFNLAMLETSKELQNFCLAYHQSDEVSFLLLPSSDKSQIWFDGNVNKLNSITSSIFTYWFNRFIKSDIPAFFDCRCFTVPIEDVPNYFVWRQIDYRRNSINMVASSLYSHSELMNKNSVEKMRMILPKGVSWELIPNVQKYGSFYLNNKEFVYSYLNYYQIMDLIRKDIL